MTGFLDGINESLKGYENPIDTMEEATEVRIEIDPEKLYYNMVEAKANWLYELPQWDSILTEERRKDLVKQIKRMGEESKVAARNVRREAMDAIKKMKNAKTLSEDEVKACEQDVEKKIAACIEDIDKAVSAKEKELMTV